MQPTPEEVSRHEEYVAKFLTANLAEVKGLAERVSDLLTSEKLILFLGMEVVMSSTERSDPVRTAMRLRTLRDRVNFQIYLEGRG